MIKNIRHATIRFRLFFAFSAVTLVLVTAFTFMSYQEEKDIYLTETDNVLKATAYAVPAILPERFQSRVTNAASVTPDEYMANVTLLSDFAKETGVAYLYTFMEISNQVVFTSTSVSQEQLQSGDWAHFFDAYTDASDALKGLFRKKGVVFETTQDEFGTFRSCLVGLTAADGRPFVAGADIRIDDINQKLRETLVKCILIGLAGFVVVFFASWMISNRLARPLIRLVTYTERLSAGGFTTDPQSEAEITAMVRRGPKEVSSLAQGFSSMLVKLHQYIEELRITTAVKERIESELKIAHDIQMSLLRKTFPPFPNRKDIDIYAILTPAKEVGGDFYDFAFIDEERLYFCVADVSDKGVPAALYMAVTMALMRRTAKEQGVDQPSEILNIVNRELVDENSDLMFVTVFCGILNIRTGQMLYSNAGHTPPFVLGQDGKVTKLALPPGVVLGVIKDVQYTTKAAVLKPEDMLILYTDGVTEAKNVQSELYKEEGLFAALNGAKGLSAEACVKRINQSVSDFAGSADQSDDITILTIRTKNL